MKRPLSTAASRPLPLSQTIPTATQPDNTSPGAIKTSLLDLPPDTWTSWLHHRQEPPFRRTQMEDWIYRKYVDRFAAMTNLPPALRTQLAQEFAVLPLELETYSVSRRQDTLKALFRLQDGESVEAVLMLYDKRQTLCISSQAGCAMGCQFCATGLGGLSRNLTPGEIVGQVLFLSRLLAYPQLFDIHLKAHRARVSNIVYMGMGEPLHNYEAVWSSIRMLVSPHLYGLGARHVTVSTIGLAPQIVAMAREDLPVRLAVSLHAPNDALRTQLVPPAQRWKLKALLHAVKRYIQATNRRVTFEYVMLAGVNDDLSLAVQLGELLRGLLCHVNLIPFNPIPGDTFQSSTDDHIREFAMQVRACGLPVSVRVRRGISMDAGCGQLRLRTESQQGSQSL